MTEYVEVRLRWPDAAAIFAPDDGDLVSDDVFKVVLRSDDMRLQRVGELNRQRHGRLLFGWNIQRRYTPAELDAARAFRLMIVATFEPEGESCGTTYERSEACRVCGRGRRVVGPLRLDLSKLPKSKDIAESIAGDEWVVTQRLAEAITDAGLTGLELRPVVHRREDAFWESVNLRKYNAGQELLRRAESAGYYAESPELWVWMRRDQQRPLLEKLDAELDARAARRQPGRRFTPWYQLVAIGAPVMVDQERTRFGVRPVDDDPQEAPPPACGHVRGLNILSELFLRENSGTGEDFTTTDAYVGDQRGVLVPFPLIVVSPKFRRLLDQGRFRGYQLEIARFV